MDGRLSEHAEELDSLSRRLRALGWASFVSVDRLLRDWEQLAAEVGDYGATIDDYTNDVTARDGLAQALEWASDRLTEALRPLVEQADEVFRNATVNDVGVAVGQYFRIENKDGWWWRRRPTTGPLAEYLDRGSHRAR